MNFKVRLRAGTRYQTRAAFFGRRGDFHVLEDHEVVKPLRLDLEPGSFGVFERANGEKIIVLYEDDPRDADEEQVEEMEPMTDKIEEWKFTAATPVGTFVRVSRNPDLRWAIVYLPEARRLAGWEGFCHGWAQTDEHAQRLADEVREQFHVEPVIAPITGRRRWVSHAPRWPEE
ncbi:MAG: hypothetical protein QM704_21520 [Anaeromyxobacteraceae bacterium]